ncbi:MAG: exo-beta-N-acetylmuramidase NamZ domain-containing protein, partial [Ferruginibacter sp.]
MKTMFFLMVVLFFSFCGTAKQGAMHSDEENNSSIKTGAEQIGKYLDYLKGKRVAVMANPTSIIGKRHLVDSLKSLGINIIKVFGPEHGFRGNASAGAIVNDEIDQASGIPVISLYGKKNKPTAQDMADV